MTLSSYNRFQNNCHRDAWIISFGNCGTSVFAGFVIFSIVGFMAHDLGVDVKDVAESGPGLAFVTYPEVVTRLPISPFWSCIFFFMLITIGLDSQFVTMETVITAVVDHVPRLLPYKMWVTMAMCTLWFLLGLIMTTQGGVYVLELLSNYASGWCIMIIAIIEMIAVIYVYGFRNLQANILTMLGYQPLKYWWISNWIVFTPLILVSILFWSLYSATPLTYGEYEFPGWANRLGWAIAFGTVIPVPVIAMIVILKHKAHLGWWLFKPSLDWAPAHKIKQRMANVTPFMTLPTDDDKLYRRPGKNTAPL